MFHLAMLSGPAGKEISGVQGRGWVGAGRETRGPEIWMQERAPGGGCVTATPNEGNEYTLNERGGSVYNIMTMCIKKNQARIFMCFFF